MNSNLPDIPRDAKPYHGKCLKSINPRDKYERGVGFNYQEGRAFYGICDCGTNQLISCYRSSDYEMNVYDFISLCRHCPYFVYQPPSYSFNDKHNVVWCGKWLYDWLKKQEWLPVKGDESKWLVYFISDGEYVKIGVTNDLNKRLGQLQTSNARKLEVLFTVKLNSSNAAFSTETTLHETYKDYRREGEWFAILKELNVNNWKYYFKDIKNKEDLTNVT